MDTRTYGGGGEEGLPPPPLPVHSLLPGEGNGGGNLGGREGGGGEEGRGRGGKCWCGHNARADSLRGATHVHCHLVMSNRKNESKGGGKEYEGKWEEAVEQRGKEEEEKEDEEQEEEETTTFTISAENF